MLLDIKRYTVPIYQTAFADWNDLIDFYVLINSGGSVHTKADLEKAIGTKI